jgi:heat shock protein beta
MAPVLSRSLATASLASLPSSSSFPFSVRNINSNRVLNLTSAFLPQNGLRNRKGFNSSTGLSWKFERRNHRFGLRCEAAAVAEKEAADTSGENFEYQAEVRLFFSFTNFHFFILFLCFLAG